MHAIKGKYRNGQIVLDEKADWPENTEVRVEPIATQAIGMREEEWPTDPAGIAALIARMDALQPWLTPQEEAEWKAALQAQKEYELATWDEQCKKIERLFQ